MISSLYNDKNALGGFTINEDLKNKIWKCVEKIKVSQINFEKSKSMTYGVGPDILLIDAEGMDAEIIDLIVIKKSSVIGLTKISM